MLVAGKIPSLINGVSQQPLSQRLSSQGTVQENAVSSPADGLSKRPPTEHVARLLAESGPYDKVHFIDRDENEKYVAVFHGERVMVYDLTGKRYNVYGTKAAYDYLSTSRPSRDITCLTLADQTLVVNKTVSVRRDREHAYPNQLNMALVWIRAGNYGSTYRIKLNRHIDIGIETSSDDVTQIGTQKIAEDLAAEIQDRLDGAWHVEHRTGDSVIWIHRDDEDAFEIEGSDSQAGSALTVIGRTVPRFSDLPPLAPKGMVVKVDGDPGSGSDDYWVRFDTFNELDGMWPGRWVECAEPGNLKDLDPLTMPHRLIRNQDDERGTMSGVPYGLWFRFEPIPWNSREVGNDDSSPWPSFVDERITDAFLYRNRLGFTAASNVVLSRAGDYFNFWRGSLQQVLDSDPIDLTHASPRVSGFTFAVPFAGSLLLFGERAQVELRAGDSLTPKTASLISVSEYESSSYCRPVASRSSLFIPYVNGEWGGIHEYYIEGASGQRAAEPVSLHVPRYFREPSIATASSVNQMLVLMDTRNRNRLFIYKWYVNGQDRIQSSWSNWIMGDKNIFGFEFIGNLLYLVIERNCGMFLEKIDISRSHDPDSRYNTLLDRRVDESRMVIHYDQSIDRSIITLPYRIDGEPLVVTRGGGNEAEGRVFPIEKMVHACDPDTYEDPTNPTPPPDVPPDPPPVDPDPPVPPEDPTGDGGPGTPDDPPCEEYESADSSSGTGISIGTFDPGTYTYQWVEGVWSYTGLSDGLNNWHAAANLRNAAGDILFTLYPLEGSDVNLTWGSGYLEKTAAEAYMAGITPFTGEFTLTEETELFMTVADSNFSDNPPGHNVTYRICRT